MLSCIITNVVTKDDDRLCHVEWATQNEPKVRIDAECENLAMVPTGLSASLGHLQDWGRGGETLVARFCWQLGRRRHHPRRTRAGGLAEIDWWAQQGHCLSFPCITIDLGF